MNWQNILTGTRDVLKTEIFEIAGTRVSLATLLTVVVILFATFAMSRLLRRGIERTFKSRGVNDVGTTAVVTKLLHYVVVLLGGGVALQTVGVDLGALFAAGAFFAVGIGFAMQTVMQNFVSGLILMLERSITPDDVLSMNGTIVRVKRMGIRSTVAVTLDGEDLLLPNSTIVQNEVKNLTLDRPDFRINVSVGVAYGSDMKLVERTLQKVAVQMHDDKSKGEPLVFLREFGDSSVVFDVALWTRDPWTVRRLRSTVHFAIWEALQKADITIAFPQVDVHFDEGIRRAG